jgi:pilus assembly protein Flp/PilA
MTKLVKSLWADEGGASAAEYALILAIVGSAIALAAIGLGNAISTRMKAATNCIKSTTSAQYTSNCV